MIQFTRRAISVGGFEIYWYGLLIALGVLAGFICARAREKRLGLEKDCAADLVLLGVPIAILCARLYYVLFSWEYYAARPAEIFALRDGGLAIYGGVIGAMIAGWIYSGWKKIPFASLADLAAPGLALGQCIGRWGNFLNGEAYGAAVESPVLQFFPVSVYIGGSGWHYATFFYESLWCGLTALLLLLGEKKGFFRRRGDIFLSYIFLYALERVAVEGLRTDSLYLGNLRISQVLSLIAVFLTVCLLMKRSGRKIVLLPLTAAGMIFAGIIFHSTLLTAAAALICLGTSAAIYKHTCA